MPTLALDVVKLSVVDFSLSYILPLFNPTALRKAKIVYNIGLSECNRVKQLLLTCFFIIRAQLFKTNSH